MVHYFIYGAECRKFINILFEYIIVITEFLYTFALNARVVLKYQYIPLIKNTICDFIYVYIYI